MKCMSSLKDIFSYIISHMRFCIFRILLFEMRRGKTSNSISIDNSILNITPAF